MYYIDNMSAEPKVRVLAHRGDLEPVTMATLLPKNAASFISFLNGNPRIDLADLLSADEANAIYQPVRPRPPFVTRRTS